MSEKIDRNILIFQGVMRRLVGVYFAMLSKYYRLRVGIDRGFFGRRINVGKSCNFGVPLCCNGRGKVFLGDEVVLGFRKGPLQGNGSILIQARKEKSVIEVGAGSTTGNNVTMIACDKIIIGEGCQIGDGVTIFDSDFHEINPITRKATEGFCAPVIVGENVWLGSRAMILKGVTIGDGSVIAAGSVVSKSIPARCLAAGVPAKVIREI